MRDYVLWHKPTTEEVSSFEQFDAFLGRGQADEHVGFKTQGFEFSRLDVPPGRDIDGDDGEFRVREQWQCFVERRSDGAFEREPEYCVENNVRGG